MSLRQHTIFIAMKKFRENATPGAVLRTLAFLPFVSGRTLFSRYLNGQNKTFFLPFLDGWTFLIAPTFEGDQIFLVLLTSLAWQT